MGKRSITKKLDSGKTVDDTTDHAQEIVDNGATLIVEALGNCPETDLKAYAEKAKEKIDELVAAYDEDKKLGMDDLSVLGLDVVKAISDANNDRPIMHGIGTGTQFKAALNNGSPFWNAQGNAHDKFMAKHLPE